MDVIGQTDPPTGAGLTTLMPVRLWRGCCLALRWLAAALVIGDLLVLLAGVTMRYVFQDPLIWSDELASLLFGWLAMSGAVLATIDGEHMAMTGVAQRLPPRATQFLEAAGIMATVAFLLIMLRPAISFASTESIATIMSLDISRLWHLEMFPVGFVLMAIALSMRLTRLPIKCTAAAALVVAAIFAAALAIQPALPGLGQYNLVIFFVGVTALTLLAGVPVAFCFGLAALGYVGLTTRVPLTILVARMDTGMSHEILLSIPMFVFLGLLIEMTGMAAAMIGFLASMFGHLRGGLSFVLIAAMYVVSGISGAKAADMAAVAPVLLPEMERRGAQRGELVALLAATGAQTETIPPSLILITIGSVTGVSIAALFNGGLLPGLVVGLVLCVVVWFRAERGTTAARASVGQILSSFIKAVPALCLPFLIRSAVVEGVATATEVSTIGVIYATLVGLLVHRRFDVRRLLPMLERTAVLTGAILLIVGTATSMSWAITQSGIARTISAWISTLPGGAASFMVISIVIFIVLGSVLEGIPAVVLLGPILFPLARQLGINDVHYAMVTVLSMGVGLFSPPFGVGYYTACGIARVDPSEGIRHIWRYLLAVLFGLAIVAAVPWFSTALLK